MNDQLIYPEYSICSLQDLRKNKYSSECIDFIYKYEINKKSCEVCFNQNYCYLGNYGELYKIDPLLDKEFPTCNILRDVSCYLMNLEDKGVNILKRIYGGK